MSNIIELSPDLKDILKELGIVEEETVLKALTSGFKELLIDCEKDILEFEVKYGLSFEVFKRRLDSGEFGDPFAYPIEKDAMIWEDLIKEKNVRLEALRKMEKLRAK